MVFKKNITIVYNKENNSRISWNREELWKSISPGKDKRNDKHRAPHPVYKMSTWARVL